MVLTGTYERVVDDKGRLALPKRLREDFGEGELREIFLAPGTNRSILLYSPKGFTTLAERWSQRPDGEEYLRLFYSSAERVEIDGQGRIRVSERLSNYAGITRDAVLLGVHDHVELWDAAHWTAFREQFEPKFDELARQAWANPSPFDRR